MSAEKPPYEPVVDAPAARRVPWLDRVIGDRTGDVLAWLAKRAHKRGDAHEFAHLYAAVVFGNSNHTDNDWPCGLGYVEGYLSKRGSEYRAFTITITPPPAQEAER